MTHTVRNKAMPVWVTFAWWHREFSYLPTRSECKEIVDPNALKSARLVGRCGSSHEFWSKKCSPTPQHCLSRKWVFFFEDFEDLKTDPIWSHEANTKPSIGAVRLWKAAALAIRPMRTEFLGIWSKNKAEIPISPWAIGRFFMGI